MSNTIRTHKKRDAGKDRHLQSVNRAETTRPASGCGSAEDSLLAALRANPNCTTAELASKAGIGRSTAGKILARLADEGTVTRINGIAAGGRRPADRWTPCQADGPTSSAQGAHGARERATDATPAGATPRPNASKPTAATIKSQRLAPGGLRELVLSHLGAHPGEELGPSQLAKTLGRSAGAINNALEKLAKDGAVVKTVEAPKRFAAPSTDKAAGTGAKAGK